MSITLQKLLIIVGLLSLVGCSESFSTEDCIINNVNSSQSKYASRVIKAACVRKGLEYEYKRLGVK